MTDRRHPWTVRSDCGRVSVTVPAPGALPTVTLSRTATLLGTVELAQLIVATAAVATEDSTVDPAPESLDDALHHLRELQRHLRDGDVDAALTHGREQLGVPAREAEPADARGAAPTKPVSGPPPGAESLDQALALLERIRAQQASQPADGPPLAGHAASETGSVRLIATVDRPIAELSLSRTALALGPTLLAEEINALVERATADLRERQNRALADAAVPIDLDEAARSPDRAHALGRAVFAQLAEVHAAHTTALRHLRQP